MAPFSKCIYWEMFLSITEIGIMFLLIFSYCSLYGFCKVLCVDERAQYYCKEI